MCFCSVLRLLLICGWLLWVICCVLIVVLLVWVLVLLRLSSVCWRVVGVMFMCWMCSGIL